MFRVGWMTIGLNALLLAGFAGCSQQNHCDDDINYPGCSAMPMQGDITLLTPRINKTEGGTIKVQVVGAKAGVKVSGMLETVALTFADTAADGTAQAMVTAAQMASLREGANSLSLSANMKVVSPKIRLFSPPRLGSGPTERFSGPTLTTKPPRWMKIIGRLVYSLEEAAANKNQSVYQTYQTAGNGVLVNTPGVPGILSGSVDSKQLVDIAQDVSYQTDLTQPVKINALSLMGSGAHKPIFTSDLSTANLFSVESSGRLALLGNGSGLRAIALPAAIGDMGTLVSLSPVPATVKFAAAGLLNDDAQPDVVASDGASASEVWIRQPGGMLNKDAKYTVNLSGINALQVLDMDRDQLDDLVVLRSGKIEYLANEGNGAFTASSLIDTMISGEDVLAVGDNNNDKAVDIAVASTSANTITLYLNTNKPN